MQKRFLFILFFIVLFISTTTICYAIDIDTNTLSNNYKNTTNNSITNNITNTNSNESRQNITNTSTTPTPTQPINTTGQVTTNMLPEAELGLSNILNIILIVVGVLLILLGIAIIIRMK